MDAQKLCQYIWEGACSVSRTLDGRHVEGEAYAEVAYALPQTEPTPLRLALLFYEIIRHILRRFSRQAAWALDGIFLCVGKILGVRTFRDWKLHQLEAEINHAPSQSCGYMRTIRENVVNPGTWCAEI